METQRLFNLKMLYPQILSKNQQEALAKLGVLDKDYYLAGGTALALQLGHRTSLDFDLYNINHFSNEGLIKKLKGAFLTDFKANENQPKDTLFAEIMGIKMSVFYYPYPLINNAVKFPPIKLASIEDISAMKVVAIVQRGKQRDFIDLYYLINKIGINKILESAYQKYPWYREMDEIVFYSLTYFDDAEKDKGLRAIRVLDPNFSWEKAKETIRKEIKKYQLL